MGSKPRAPRKPKPKAPKPRKPRIWKITDASQIILKLARKARERAQEDYSEAVSGAIRASNVPVDINVSVTGDKWTEVINPTDTLAPPAAKPPKNESEKKPG